LGAGGHRFTIPSTQMKKFLRVNNPFFFGKGKPGLPETDEKTKRGGTRKTIHRRGWQREMLEPFWAARLKKWNGLYTAQRGGVLGAKNNQKNLAPVDRFGKGGGGRDFLPFEKNTTVVCSVRGSRG